MPSPRWPSSPAPPPDFHTLLLALNASALARGAAASILSAAASAATNTANITTTRRASSRFLLLASASPLAPFLCCKCPAAEQPLPVPAGPCVRRLLRQRRHAQQCQRCSRRNPPCYTVESQRRCFCPEWAVTATDLFERVNPNVAGLAIGPAWADTDFHGQTWPISARAQLETADNAGARRRAAQRGCTQRMYYEPTVSRDARDGRRAVVLQAERAWQYERRMVDPTEPFGWASAGATSTG